MLNRAAIILGLSLSSAPLALAAQRCVVKDAGAIIGVSPEALLQVLQFTVDDDMAAVKVLEDRGQIASLKPGTPLYLIEKPPAQYRGTLRHVRLAGQPDLFWILETTLKNLNCPKPSGVDVNRDPQASESAGESWVIWGHTFNYIGGYVHEGWSRSAAFSDQQSCLKEQQWRQKESLARQCKNIWTGVRIPDCQAVSADGPTGVQYRYKDGSRMVTYWPCWPASVDPRH
jgi:hypothetical protein